MRGGAKTMCVPDYQEALILGEDFAIGILRDQKNTYNEDFSGFVLTRFDGREIRIR